MHRLGSVAEQVDEDADEGRLIAHDMGVGRQLHRDIDALELKAGQTLRGPDGVLQQEDALAVVARLLVGEGLEVGDDVLHPLHAFAGIDQAFLEHRVLLDRRQ